VSEEIGFEEEVPTEATGEKDLLTSYLSKSNPRIPVVIQTDEGAKILGFLRFVQSRGRYRIGRGEDSVTFEGFTCGIELVISRSQWNTYKKTKIRKGEKYYHFRIQMLDPFRLNILATRLQMMAQMLLLKTILVGVKGKTVEKKEVEVKTADEFELERE